MEARLTIIKENQVSTTNPLSHLKKAVGKKMKLQKIVCRLEIVYMKKLKIQTANNGEKQLKIAIKTQPTKHFRDSDFKPPKNTCANERIKRSIATKQCYSLQFSESYLTNKEEIIADLLWKFKQLIIEAFGVHYKSKDVASFHRTITKSVSSSRIRLVIVKFLNSFVKAKLIRNPYKLKNKQLFNQY